MRRITSSPCRHPTSIGSIMVNSWPYLLEQLFLELFFKMGPLWMQTCSTLMPHHHCRNRKTISTKSLDISISWIAKVPEIMYISSHSQNTPRRCLDAQRPVELFPQQLNHLSPPTTLLFRISKQCTQDCDVSVSKYKTLRDFPICVRSTANAMPQHDGSWSYHEFNFSPFVGILKTLGHEQG